MSVGVLTELRDRIFGTPQTRSTEYTKFTDLHGLISVYNAINGTYVPVVTPRTAMSITAIFSCVELICDTCSLISPKIYKQDLLGKQIDFEHDQYTLLSREVNSYTSTIEFDKIWTRDYLIWGNGYAEIKRNARGRPVEYVNLLPWEIEVIFKDGEKRYIYSPANGEKRTIASKNMLHLSKISSDHTKAAESPISLNSTSINDHLTVIQYGQDMYKNGVQLSGYIFGDKPLDGTAREALRTQFESKYKDKSGQVGILPHGFKYEQLKYNLPMADANIIEAKKLGVEDISRIYRVPEVLLNLSETADNKSESMYNIFLTTTIAPIQILKDKEYTRKIFRTSEKSHYVKHELKGLYRTSMKERYEAHSMAINAGWLKKNEVREIEDYNKLDGDIGDQIMVPLNMIPASLVNKYYENMIANNNSKNKEKEKSDA